MNVSGDAKPSVKDGDVGFGETSGEGIEKVSEANPEITGNLNRDYLQSMTGFTDELESVVSKEGITVDEFNQLR